VGEEEDVEASIWPKVAAAEDAGGGRSRRETARRFGLAGERAQEREECAGQNGLGQFDRPRPEPVRVNQPGGLGWISGLKPICKFEFK
jgi:hypothetical protein